MKITDHLSKYRSKEYCNLDSFKSKPLKHDTKTWVSKNGKSHFIREMETSHLWYTFRMLMNIINEVRTPEEEFLEEERIDIAVNALQYIGHELYKREAQVPELPSRKIRKRINRADNLNKGYVDTDTGGIAWDNGDFYKE